MIEIFEIFWSSPIELRVIILGPIVLFGWMKIQEQREKWQQKHRENLK